MQNAPRSGAFLLGNFFVRAQNINPAQKYRSVAQKSKRSCAKLSKRCAKKEQQ
jgi:hypothetical protein